MSPQVRPDETARLACLRSLDILDTAPEAQFDDVATLAAQLTGCPMAAVTFVDGCHQWFKARVGIELSGTPREMSFCDHALGCERPLTVPDATRDPRFRENALVTGEFGLRFYAGAPIVVAGLPVGAVCVIDTQPRRLAPPKIEALAALARGVTSLLEARLAEERSAAAERRFAAFMDHAPAAAFLKDHEGRMRYLNQYFEKAFGLEPGELLGKVDSDWLPAVAAEETMRHDWQVRETGEMLELIEVVPTPDGIEREWSVRKFAVAVEGRTWCGGMALDVTEMRATQRAAQTERDFSEALLGTIGALVCVLDQEGRFVRFNAECERLTGWRAEEVLGRTFPDIVILPEEREGVRTVFAQVAAGDFPLSNENHWITRSGDRRLIDWRNTALLDENGDVEYVVATGVDVTLQREQKRELERLATTDGLTGVANHRAFQERLALEVARAGRSGGTLSLLLLDVDHFKRFNDAFGHPAGDEVLRRVARTLVAGARDVDLAARYGGEEFAVLMPGVGAEDAVRVAERLRETIAAGPWDRHPVTASFGAATLRFGDDPGGLVEAADRALYLSKAAGRDRTTHASLAAPPLAA